MYLGTDNENRQVIGYPGDRHLLTIGPTRSGKSRRLLIPNLLYETGRSMLVVDIKGELAAFTAAHRAAKGGKVLALDPFGILASKNVKVPVVGFNPMQTLNPDDENFVDDAMMLAEAMVQVTTEMKEPHFAESAQDVVAGLIMWCKQAFKEKASLRLVRKMICQPKDNFKVMYATAKRAGANEAVFAKLARFENPAADNRELDGVLSTAQTQTRFLDSPGIARSLENGMVDFGAMKATNTTVYLVLPPSKLMTHAKWLRLVISSAMTAMQVTVKANDRPDVLFLLDEFAQLGRLQAVETAVSLNAGYGVKVWAAVQHLGQLKDLYNDNWETFLSASCVTAFAPRDVFTRDHLTKMIGTGTKPMRSITTGPEGEKSVATSAQKDDLMSPHQWRQMVMGEFFAFIPTDKGELIKRIHSPDFTALPEVKNGTIRAAA